MFERLRRKPLESELTDEELHRSALGGSGDAMAALYKRHGGLVYRFTLRMGGDAGIAEEITQEVFLALLTQLDRYDAARGSLSTWLCGIARRKLWKHLERSPDRSKDALFDSDEETAAELRSIDDGPAEVLLRQEAVSAVRAGVDELPPLLREVVILCALEEMSYEQAAQVLAVPVGTVRSRLHRAKGRLTGLLNTEMVETEGKRR
jgi:RNA polymerase sigma-70 factor (ECF subfamily)